jgi:hypothetical protein
MRSQDWNDGRRNGIKWAIEYLHARAIEMNDPTAKTVLNTAAFNMGVEAKQPSAVSAKDRTTGE